MGGGGIGPKGLGDLKSLIERAKEELHKGKPQSRRNVFISFAYEDAGDVNLLRGQAKNEKSPLEFNDWSVSEAFESDRTPYIKQKISERIAQSSLTIVYLSVSSSKSKWVEWEIEESIRQGKTVLGVFSGDSVPKKLPDIVNRAHIPCVPWAKLQETIDGLI